MDALIVILRLEATPGLLRSVSSGGTTAQAWAPPKPGEWSIGAVVRHLVQGESDTFLPRLRRMVAEERPVFDTSGGAAPAGADLGALLDAFEAARRDAVGVLKSLDAAGWRREGVSPSRGPLSIAAYARTMADHDREHLGQIQDVRNALGLPPKRAEAQRALPIAEIVAAIRTTPERVLALADDVSPRQLRHRPRAGEWSMKEVMAHLLKVERDLFLPRLELILAQEQPSFSRFDPDAWAAERDHREGDFMEDWRGFTEARGRTITFLEAVPAGAAERIGLSGFFGPVALGA